MTTSTTYSTKDGRNARRSRTRSRRWPLWTTALVAIGALLVLLAAAASAAIILHGRAVLDVPAVSAETETDLQVSDIRLNRPLTPGTTADLLFSVRNTNAFGTRIDRVTLVGALRKVKPARCAGQVSGPVMNPTGYHLPLADQVLVGAGVKTDVVVHAAFTLAASAKTGCGFTVEVDVSATQLTSIASPMTVDPTPALTSTTPPALPTKIPAAEVPTIEPTAQITAHTKISAQARTGEKLCNPVDSACVLHVAGG